MAPILLSSIMPPASTLRTMASIRRKRRRRELLYKLLDDILRTMNSKPSSSSSSSKHPVYDSISSSHLRLSIPSTTAGQLGLEHHPTRTALAKLLENPTVWQAATKMTFESELRLRPPKLKGGSALQKTRHDHVSRIAKSWPLRCTKLRAPKGLQNPMNYCYRRSVMQSLLHLPQLLHWIDGHNQGQNACAFATPSTASGGSPGGKHVAKTAPKSSQCLACAMKAFVPLYWDPQNPHAEVPQSAVTSFDKVVRASPVVRESSLGMETQEDAEQFLSVLLNAFESSTATPAWSAQFASLFRLQATNTDTCACGTVTHPTTGAETTLRLHPNGRKDTIAAAFRRHFAPTQLEKRCAACSGPGKNGQLPPSRVHTRTQTVDAGPELLVVQLTIYDDYGNIINNGTKFDDFLDLTKYQTAKDLPLKYKLSSVVCHQGRRIDGGHYVAHVSGPQRTHIISDKVVRKTSPPSLTNVVQIVPGMGRFTPYLLFYVKIA
ncbi:cysteine proteinase [Mytilinidion resinicola]|uniref:ubiquitinyl hydrolase 1 n=1 Tax=Mytilinidion resinicola TaxID=574789 RepID=A0A6A6YVA9_9PEZI|nr:cysteine proteinase [Mytilinidion resinicola]KAF2811924.1 cysteine proteinase [Mytilinidion resinicola]